jgi:hypothetical protein
MFSGYQWDVKVGTGAPDDNIWDDANAQVDDRGSLHLKITKNTKPSGDTWHCVELCTLDLLGPGRYQFQVIGRIDKLDRNVVLGLFKYPTRDVVDGIEIDIEFSRWGKPPPPYPYNADYAIYSKSGQPLASKDFLFALQGDYTTHRFLWESDRVTFQSLYGHRDDDANEFERWQYMPNEVGLIPQQPTPVHMNLFLVHKKPPSDGAEVEIIISQFAFTPLDQL